jgi:hypothetical protein
VLLAVERLGRGRTRGKELRPIGVPVGMIQEYLQYAAQCLFMAECAATADEQAEWGSLAKLWLTYAIESAEIEVSGRESAH